MQNTHPDFLRALVSQRDAEARAHAREARLALAARKAARARRGLGKGFRADGCGGNR